MGSDDSSNYLLGRYRNLSNGLALFLSGVLAILVGTICGILGGFCAVYLYDRGNSKGDDFVVALGGLFSVGAFSGIVMFTWLQKLRRQISSRTTWSALYLCLVPPLVMTFLALGELDDHYVSFLIFDWLAILLLIVLAVLLCRRWWNKSENVF